MLQCKAESRVYMENKECLKLLIQKYPNLSALKVSNHFLTWQNKTVNLETINIYSFLKANKNLVSNLSKITSEDFINILNIHHKSLELQNDLSQIKLFENNFLIKNIRLISRFAEDGLLKNYIYIIDVEDKSYIILNNSTVDINKIYDYLAKKNFGNVLINNLIKEINNEEDLKKSLSIDKYFTMLKSDNLTLEELNKMQELENLLKDMYYYQECLLSSNYQLVEYYFNTLDKINKEYYKTDNEVNALNRVYNNLSKLKLERPLELTRKKSQNSGFLNIVLLILLVIILTISLCCWLWRSK